jgi:GNAT superfamily N-acetyltransferase
VKSRQLTVEDLSVCQAIFNESYYDLHRRHETGTVEEDTSWLEPILSHFLQTDPAGGRLTMEGATPVGFASTIRRDDYWFVSFLFVVPDHQGAGVGRQLLTELVPDDGHGVVRATVVESFQPVSTGLFASLGMTPRAIKYWLSGLSRPGTLPELPSDLQRVGISSADLDDVDQLDRAVLGFERRADHRWWGTAGHTWVGVPAWKRSRRLRVRG